MKPKFVSELSSLYFDVPSDPDNRKLKGLDVTFRYTISGDDCAWFCKISTTNGVDFMYNPKVFGKPESDKVGIWLSYWPIGNILNVGDIVNVSVVVKSGLEVHECGVSLVYADDRVAEENNKGWVEILGGDLSGFQLSTGSYYLCRRDFFELMEVDRPTPDWSRILVGDTVHIIEVQGWRKTGRPKQLSPSFTELKTVRCIIHGPELEEIYKIKEMSKSSFVDRTLEFPSSMLGETMKSATFSNFSDRSFVYRTVEFRSSMLGETMKSATSSNFSDTTIKEIVLGVNLGRQTQEEEVIEALSALQGIQSIHFDTRDDRLTVIGDIDPANVVSRVSKIETANIISVGPAEKHETDVRPAYTSSAKKQRSSTSSISSIIGSRSTITDQDRLS